MLKALELKSQATPAEFLALRDDARAISAAASGTLLAPANTVDQMSRIVFNDYLDAGLAGLSVAIVLVVVVYAIVDIARALGSPTSTAVEVGGATLAAAE